MGDDFDELVLGDAVVDGAAEVARELLGAVEGDEGGDVIRERSRLASPGRSQTSPNRTSSVSSTSLGAKSPMICWAGEGWSGMANLQ